MTWEALLDIITDEAGKDIAARIEKRANMELGGTRLMISLRPVVRAMDIHRAAPGKPIVAAKKLGIHPTTAYRKLRKARLIR